MSESPAQSGGTADPSQGGGKANEQTKPNGNATPDPKTDDVTVDRSAEEYAKRLKETSAEAKRHRQENAALKARLEELEQKSLTEQGNWKEVAEKAQAKAKESEEKLKKANQTFAFKSVSSQVATEALKLGCIDTDALVKLADLSELEVKEDFSVEPESIKTLLAEMQKAKPFLFEKAAPKIADAIPNGKGTPPKKLENMTLQEKEALLKQLQASGK